MIVIDKQSCDEVVEELNRHRQNPLIESNVKPQVTNHHRHARNFVSFENESKRHEQSQEGEGRPAGVSPFSAGAGAVP